MSTIVKYPLDLSGLNPTNRVTDESIIVPRTTGRHFAPEYGPFYADTMRVKTLPGNVQLTPGTDFECLFIYEELTRRSGLAVTAVVSILNPALYGTMELEYQTVGGEFSTSVSVIQQLIENLEIDNRAVQWDDILNKPVTFTPSPHLHHVGDLYGMEDVVDELVELRYAIQQGNDAVLAQLELRMNQLAVSNATMEAGFQDLQMPGSDFLIAGTPAWVLANTTWDGGSMGDGNVEYTFDGGVMS